MRKFLKMLLSLPATIANWVALKRKHITAGAGLQINGRIAIHGNGHIIFGQDVTIHSSGNANPAAGEGRTHLTVGDEAELKIGNYCGLSNCAITAMRKVEIEDHVLVGAGTMITDTDFHSIVIEERIGKDDSTAKTAAVRIQEGAFIGARCIILKGVTIGKRSVVGAGSVVTRSIPDDEIWGGNPVAFIKKIR